MLNPIFLPSSWGIEKDTEEIQSFKVVESMTVGFLFASFDPLENPFQLIIARLYECQEELMNNPGGGVGFSLCSTGSQLSCTLDRLPPGGQAN